MFTGIYELRTDGERIFLPVEWEGLLSGEWLVVHEDTETGEQLCWVLDEQEEELVGQKEIMIDNDLAIPFYSLARVSDKWYALGLGYEFEINDKPEPSGKSYDLTDKI